MPSTQHSILAKIAHVAAETEKQFVWIMVLRERKSLVGNAIDIQRATPCKTFMSSVLQ